MDLWIRSQDKMALAKFDLCVLEQYEGNYMFIADHYKNMGVYKSKERALEVLDEIQKLLNPICLLNTDLDKLGLKYHLSLDDINKLMENITKLWEKYTGSKLIINGLSNDMNFTNINNVIYQMSEE